MAETLREALASNQQDWHKGEDTAPWPSSQLPAKDPAILYSSGDTVSFIWQLMNGILFKAKMILQVISPSNYQSHYLFSCFYILTKASSPFPLFQCPSSSTEFNKKRFYSIFVLHQDSLVNHGAGSSPANTRGTVIHVGFTSYFPAQNLTTFGSTKFWTSLEQTDFFIYKEFWWHMLLFSLGTEIMLIRGSWAEPVYL